jgi:hypothetical protein
MKKFCILVASIFLFTSHATAQTWAGPDPERRPRMFGQGDLDFILSELCFPVVVQLADPAQIVRERRLPTAFGSRDWNGGQPIYLIGQGDVMVGFNTTTPGVTTCTARITGGNVEGYRSSLEQSIATFPVPLTVAAAQSAPNTYAARVTYCGPVDGPQYMILSSFGAPAVRAMVTVARFESRQSVCDGPE